MPDYGHGMPRRCAEPGCERFGKVTRGLCDKHYMRLLTHGTTDLEPLQLARRVAAFWTHIEKTDDCWLWHGARNSFGYGSLGKNYRYRNAHRFSWYLEHGDILVGQFVLHRCDVPACVRPDHLFLGDARDNSHDMCRKGRHWSQKGR